MATCKCGCGLTPPLATRTRNGNIKGQPTHFLTGHTSGIWNQEQRKLPAAAVVSKLYADGLTQREIAARFGTTQASVKRFMQRHEIVARVARPNWDRHPSWRGDEAGYAAVHNWVARHKKRTGICSDCGSKTKTAWSNVNHLYRRDLGEYVERCRACHTAYDKEVVS